jgi:hypothetical protein
MCEKPGHFHSSDPLVCVVRFTLELAKRAPQKNRGRKTIGRYDKLRLQSCQRRTARIIAAEYT